MSHKHARILDAILKGPAAGNIHWRDIESLLHHLDARIESRHGARLRVLLNGIETSLHHPHHSGVCDKNEIRHLRKFLISAGVGSSTGQTKNQ
ncbi:MAG: type II toxin-antitoxin system HicA family toxin [Gammaproteobacteria bacterium]|nr:type II toxin-antitoxin system HicA family toxin [Gammaproteobacteria bacterium]